MKKVFVCFILLVSTTLFFGSIVIQNPIFEDQNIKVGFAITKGESGSEILAIQIINKTDKPIKIIWDETLLTDNNGRTSGIVHSGIKFINIDKPQVPSVIPPKKTLTDVIIPKTHIYYSDGWKIKPLSETPSECYFLLTYELEKNKYYLEGTLLLQNKPDEIQDYTFEFIIGIAITIGVLAILGLIGSLF